MSNLKDTDIDDLFRRASDKYPLRTDSADWDRMAAALENKGPIPPDGPVAPEEKRKRRFFWLFLLLLPLAGAGYYTWRHAGSTGNTVGSGSITAAATVNSEAPAAAASTPAAPASTAPASTTAAAAKTPTPTRPNATASGSGAPTAAPATAAATTTAVPTTVPAAAATTGTHGANPKDAIASDRSAARIYRTRNHETGGVKNSLDANPDGLDATTGNSLDAATANGLDANNAAAHSLTATNPGGDRLFYDLRRAAIARDYRVVVHITAPAVKKDSVKAKARTKHFYAGLFGSPDLSTVKMQSVKGVGTTFGILFGYTFNGGHWAIETGVNLDRKKYYSEGEYFNTKEIRLPYNSWLTDVDGICYMWEIPLNVRYNFNPGAKTSWFATAGFSTYLMTHEKYAYGLEWPGSTSTYDSTWNFHKPSQYPFSIINLSAGFEQRLGKIGNLRIEPYVRLPLTGLGKGKLPIMSAGVNIGITRQLW